MRFGHVGWNMPVTGEGKAAGKGLLTTGEGPAGAVGAGVAGAGEGRGAFGGGAFEGRRLLMTSVTLK